MRRIITGFMVFALVAVMLLAFTSCGEDGNVESEATIRPISITLTTYGDATSDAVAKVQAALNRITEPKYNTHIILNVFSKEEYEEKLSQMIEANENGQVKLGVNSQQTDDTAVVTIVNELGRVQTVYPSADPNQLDIFLVPEGYANFMKYLEDGYLSGLTTYLSDINGKLLNQYIPSRVLDFFEKENALYGIPSMVPYGDCEFLLINRDLLAEYNYTTDEITGIDSKKVQSFLTDIAKDISRGKNTDVIPLYNVSCLNLISLTDRPSVVAKTISNGASINDGSFTPVNILSESTVQSMCKLVNEINTICGVMPVTDESVDFDKKFAAGFIKGDMSIPDVYSDDYIVIKTRVAIADTDEIYNGVYAISSFADEREYSDRCMQILTCLNTNKAFRNLLGYGVENEHYIINEDTKYISRISDDYVMDLTRTGNMFLLMQNDEMTEKELVISADDWKYAIAANQDALISPYAKIKIDFSESRANSTADYKVLSEIVPELEKLYDQLWVWIGEYPTYVDSETGKQPTFTTYLTDLKDRLSGSATRGIPGNVYVKSALTTTNPNSLRMQYTNWYDSMFGTEE